MDKNLAGLIGAASLLAIPAQAATAAPPTYQDAMQASSYADLLKPTPNASALLKASTDARISDSEPGTQARVQQAQFWVQIGPRRPWYYHHHHHHHWYYHHHHHHHYYRHHHHHHT
jgi:hypothetical protein